jgi:maleylpyruvate isomerase
MSTRQWMDECTGLFLATLDRLSDAELASDQTVLPGWTRRHLVAHVHYNAEALRRLARWAATGQRCPMYAGPEQRTEEIASGAGLPPDKLRLMVRSSARELGNDLDGLSEQAWHREIVTAQGRTVDAVEIPWMRTREVAVHAIDLASDTDFTDLPADLVIALVDDVVHRRITKGEGPELARWLTGRTQQAPHLDTWL